MLSPHPARSLQQSQKAASKDSHCTKITSIIYPNFLLCSRYRVVLILSENKEYFEIYLDFESIQTPFLSELSANAKWS
jgi:hypothetical protein